MDCVFCLRYLDLCCQDLRGIIKGRNLDVVQAPARTVGRARTSVHWLAQCPREWFQALHTSDIIPNRPTRFLTRIDILANIENFLDFSKKGRPVVPQECASS